MLAAIISNNNVTLRNWIIRTLIKYLDFSDSVYTTILNSESLVLRLYIYACISHISEVFTAVISLSNIKWLVSLIKACSVLSEVWKGVMWIQRASPCDICGEPCVTERAIFPSTLGFLSQYYSTHAPYFNFIIKPLLPEGCKEKPTKTKKKLLLRK
jgi:hypothetical protein